jgi:hypothetical protein
VKIEMMATSLQGRNMLLQNHHKQDVKPVRFSVSSIRQDPKAQVTYFVRAISISYNMSE